MPVIKRMGSTKRPPSLADSIDEVCDVILNGTESQKEAFSMHFYTLAETPQWLKSTGINKKYISGDYFSVKYGVISRHFGKDANHNLTAQDWKELCRQIAAPFAISEYKNGFRFFLNLKINGNWTAAGIDVKNPAKDLQVNAVTTVFGYETHGQGKENLFWVSEKAAPEQIALLNRLNSGQYLSAPVSA